MTPHAFRRPARSAPAAAGPPRASMHRTGAHRTGTALVLAGLAALALLPATAAAATRGVTLRDRLFSPRTVIVERGDAVVWRWRDGGTPHNVTSSRFRSSATKTRGTHAVTFRRAGRFGYRCTLHSGMTGTVVVRR